MTLAEINNGSSEFQRESTGVKYVDFAFAVLIAFPVVNRKGGMKFPYFTLFPFCN